MTTTGTDQELTPDRIMEVGMGFWPAKVLLTAVKLGLFGELAAGPRPAAGIAEALGLQQRGLYDFLDALVALGFVEREGIGEAARYRNAPEADRFLDPAKPTYVGAALEMANDRMYPFWGDLENALETGEPQNEIKHQGRDVFEKLYEDPARLEQFANAMGSAQMGAFQALAGSFDFSRYSTLCDLGGARGDLSICVAREHEHLQCVSVDLPAVEPLARQRIRQAGLEHRVEARSLDFWEDPIPRADVITMGHILHDWGTEEKKRLIGRSFHSLNEGGALVAVESVIDDQRRENAFGLLMSLNMLIETPGGANFTGEDFAGWTAEAGFRDSEVFPLSGPMSAAVAYK
ncbi:methyltransferase [Ectothiorhodospiraceae bacterium WFHF3C12]|nr:methyltransferase [Ectothiorhodospiraceae bacterium WFHF3C12]